MIEADNPLDNDDPFDLNRFVDAQKGVYEQALSELRRGEKRSHWMWYIFPQIEGLGFSATSRRYSIKSAEEARSYLRHPVLGRRLVECCEAVMSVSGRSVSEIFGYPDDMKLKSSMTLFAAVAQKQELFTRVLGKYFHGERDLKTVELLGSRGGS